MFPWRPLGMLAFGLTVIFFFIRLHGNGYDFPVKVAEFLEELEFPKRPDRSFIEISGENFRDGISNKVHTSSSSRTEHGREHKDHTYSRAEGDIGGSASESGATAGGNDGGKEHVQNFMAGWNSQWHLGKKKTANAESGNGEDHDLQEGADDGQQWIWMTNVWHEDSDCGPGYLRQYRRRLDHVLMDDNSTTWELMYTHKFPGPITHTSLSKRVIPVSSTDEGVEGSHGQRGQESIRLAVVCKVVEDEHVTYRSRVYHFGIFQSRDDLRECGSTSTETCHAHAPFVSFDYVLPGSTPIKDFTLEHDHILYSRLSDTALFRSLKLPILKVGATSPERPYALSYSSPGPLLNCREKKNVPYRMSYLSKVPSSSESDDFHVLMGQVQEYRNIWDYQLSVATEVTEAITGNKKWLTGQQWAPREFQRLMQENDMINDEPHTYGVSVQKPYIIRSADGSSIHIPIKDVVVSLETNQHTLLEDILTHFDQIEPESGHSLRSLIHDIYTPASAPSPDSAKPGSSSPYSSSASQSQQRLQKRKRGGDHYLIPLLGTEQYLIPSSNLKEQWIGIESHIDLGSLDTIDTDQGVVNDAGDILVLRTTRNGLLILKRQLNRAISSLRNSHWRLSMIMSDDYYMSEAWKRDVVAMKIVSVQIPVQEEPKSDNQQAETESQDGPLQPSTDTQASSVSDIPAHDDPDSRAVIHNILVLVYGSGRVYGYDLDVATESSSVIMFLKDKYPVVIGMLAVVVAFAINEAR